MSDNAKNKQSSPDAADLPNINFMYKTMRKFTITQSIPIIIYHCLLIILIMISIFSCPGSKQEKGQANSNSGPHPPCTGVRVWGFWF